MGLTATATDNYDDNPRLEVTVYADEEDEEPTGDRRHSPDAVALASGTLRLRAERKGDGDGRVYLVVLTATDAAGNVGRSCCTVVVPKSQNASAIAAVNGHAAAAEAYCKANGAAPPGFVPVGETDAPVLGPRQ
ncbi:MAG: hypothetical protein HYZ53_10290 [Planctomycetes bacterium]|nr:hypothetical protein [Planctomycetota bacterium]